MSEPFCAPAVFMLDGRAEPMATPRTRAEMIILSDRDKETQGVLRRSIAFER